MSRRKVTTAATLLVLLAVLGVMAVVGYRQLTAPFPGSSTSASKPCNGPEKQVKGFLKRRDVQVSVYNAGTRQGAASSTLQKLEAAGFRAGDAGNAPRSADVRRALVWTTQQNDLKARLVALALGHHTRVEVTETDLGPGIDVLVGNKYKGLARKSPKKLKLPRPVETCIQVD